MERRMSDGGEATRSGAWDLLARAAAERDGEQESGLRHELLEFTIDGDRYAVPVERVREIVRLRPITQVPRVPREILGVISLRGEIVQVMDLRTRLAAAAAPATRTSRIVVLHGDDGDVTGLLVDTVEQVLRVDESAFQRVAGQDEGFVADLCEHEGRFVSLLALDRVLDLEAHTMGREVRTR